MKTFIAVVVLALVVVGGWFFIKDKPVPESVIPTDTEAVTITNDGSYAISTSSSSMTWQGSKPLVPGYSDVGQISLQGGTLVVTDGAIASGSFVVDMNSIDAKSTGRGDGQDLLSRHLKSADFFDVEKFPTATFVITSTTPTGEITGDLTIKGITESVTFQADISEEGETLMAEATVELDRTVWDVRYGSGSFFDNLGDNVIDDNFTVTLNLVAERVN